MASLPGHPSPTPPSSDALSQEHGDQAFVSFARCMRAHGVQMADPVHVVGRSGLSVEFPVEDAATRPAFDACGHFISAIKQEKEAGAAPDLQALTNYAQCMRDHQIAMLDPTSFGALNLGNVPGITNGIGRYSPQFRSADHACRRLLPRGVHDDGTGP